METYNFIRMWLHHSNDCHRFDFEKKKDFFKKKIPFEFLQIECVESIVPRYTILGTSAMMHNSKTLINYDLHKQREESIY